MGWKGMRGRNGGEGVKLLHAKSEPHADAKGSGKAPRGELCHDQAVDSEREAEDGADSGRTSSFVGGGVEAVSAEGQDEVRNGVASALSACERKESTCGQGGERSH